MYELQLIRELRVVCVILRGTKACLEKPYQILKLLGSKNRSVDQYCPGHEDGIWETLEEMF